MQHRVILSLGSNLGDRKVFIIEAIEKIGQRVGTVIDISTLYETPSWGFDSHPFLNAAVLVHSYFSAEDILTTVLQIEKELGRNRNNTANYQARTIDIDILTYDDTCIDTPDLVIPHPQIAHRKFVLLPMADVCPNWIHPKTKVTINDLIKHTTDGSEITPKEVLIPEIRKYQQKISKYTVIEGNIGSGKTSLVKKISEDFGINTVLESFENNPFISDFYENPECKAFSLEMHFLLERVEQLSNIKLHERKISDYHLDKCLLFARQTLGDYEYTLFAKTLNKLTVNSPKIDDYIYLHQPIDKLLHQIKMRNRSFEQNISAEYLQKIDNAYHQHFEQVYCKRKKCINMSHLDFVKKPNDYLQILAEIFNE